jgi:hypothetical protein
MQFYTIIYNIYILKKKNTSVVAIKCVHNIISLYSVYIFIYIIIKNKNKNITGMNYSQFICIYA